MGESVLTKYESQDDLEKVDVAEKKPLADALKKLGVSAKVEAFPQWCEIRFDDADEYRAACGSIFTPDGMYALASAGWIPAQCGDEAMSNEPAHFKLGFFEIAVAGDPASDTEKAPALKGVMKDGREDDTAEQDREDDLNPIENPDAEMGSKREGVGKPSDGKDPEGKPKGVSEGRHKDGCQCGFCKNKGRFGKKKESGEDANAKDVVEDLLEMTSVSSVPPITEIPLMGPTRKPSRMDKLRRRKKK